MKDKYILAIDHGTSGVKTALVSVVGEVVDFEYKETPIDYLPGGGAEQDPAQWWDALVETSQKVIRRGAVSRKDIVAVSVSSTFSSTVAVDQAGGHLMNAVTWMDTRGAPYIKAAMKGWPSIMGYGLPRVLKWLPKTGGAPTLSGKDDIGHVLFIKHAFPEIYEKTFMFLPSKDYLNLRLTGLFAASYDSVHLFWVTDIRDVNHIRYNQSLIQAFGIDPEKLPPLRGATEILGQVSDKVALELGLTKGVKVVMGSPDHQTACIGSGAVRDYEGHLYVGTSSWVQCIVPFKKTDVLHSIASFPTAIPGKYQSVNEQDMAGGCLGFLLDNIIHYDNALLAGAPPENRYQCLDEIAESVPPGSHGLVFTPWLNGERTPVDDETIRGCLFNISKTTTQDHMIRAAMEGVALNSRWSLKYVERFIGRPMTPLNLVGGGGKSRVWAQIFADVLNRDIRQVKDPLQANARGAAYIAAVALNYIGFEDIPELISYSGLFSPQPENRKIYDRLFKVFVKIYKNNQRLCKMLNSGRDGE